MNKVRSTVVLDRQLASLRLLDEASKGRIMSIVFKKKDGTYRTMVCRKGVTKGVTGKGMRYRPLAKGLMPVFDMQKQEYRQVNLLTVSSFKAGGSNFLVR